MRKSTETTRKGSTASWRSNQSCNDASFKAFAESIIKNSIYGLGDNAISALNLRRYGKSPDISNAANFSDDEYIAKVIELRIPLVENWCLAKEAFVWKKSDTTFRKYFNRTLAALKQISDLKAVSLNVRSLLVTAFNRCGYHDYRAIHHDIETRLSKLKIDRTRRILVSREFSREIGNLISSIAYDETDSDRKMSLRVSLCGGLHIDDERNEGLRKGWGW